MTFPNPGPATQSTGNVAGGPYGAWSGTNTTAQIGPAGILIPLGAGGGPAIGAGANSITSGTAVFSNANGVSFGIAGQTVTASAAAGGVVLYDGANSITSGTAQFSNANGVTFGIVGQTITASVPAVGGAQTGISSIADSAHTQTVGMLSFANSNGLTFGLSTGANTATLTASYTVPSTAGLISGLNVSGGAGNSQSNVTGMTFSNANGLTFGVSTGANVVTVTGSYTVPAAQTGISGIIVSNTTYTSGTVSFSNANGISFGSSAGQAITASYTVPTQSAQTLSAIVSSNTTGNTSGMTFDARSLSMQGFGIVSVGLSTTNTGSSILFSATQSNQAMSAQGGSSAFQTLIFTNSNNVSFSNTGGSVWGSYALNLSGGAGTSNAVSGITFANSNGVTFGVSTGAAVATITASYTVPTQSNQTLGLYALSQTTGGSSSTTLDARTLSFNLYGAMSGGFSAGSIQLSVPQTSSLSAGAGISISVNGNTIIIMTH